MLVWIRDQKLGEMPYIVQPTLQNAKIAIKKNGEILSEKLQVFATESHCWIEIHKYY